VVLQSIALFTAVIKQDAPLSKISICFQIVHNRTDLPCRNTWNRLCRNHSHDSGEGDQGSHGALKVGNWLEWNGMACYAQCVQAGGLLIPYLSLLQVVTRPSQVSDFLSC
jgi:hypothetical protein